MTLGGFPFDEIFASVDDAFGHFAIGLSVDLEGFVAIEKTLSRESIFAAVGLTLKGRLLLQHPA